MRPTWIWAGQAAVLAAATATAGTPVFDFETDAEASAWRLRSAQQDHLERSPAFATSGQSSLHFTSPAWREGLEQWPAFEAQPSVADWNGYDRLVVDITNVAAEPHFLSLFVSDGQVPFRNGLSFTFSLAAPGFRRFVVPLDSFPANVDRRDIRILHLFAQRPATPMDLHLDNLRLLKPGEVAPEPAPAFVQQLAGLLGTRVQAAAQAVADGRQALVRLADTDDLRRQAEAAGARLEAEVGRVRQAMADPGLTLARLDALTADLAALPARATRAAAELRLRLACAKAGLPDRGLLVGFATSMEKLLPRDMPFDLSVAREFSLSVARNERECFQVAVLPSGAALRGVSVTVSDLASAEGAVLGRDRIDCDVVGYVQTKSRPPYAVSYVGWWPDPILDFLGPVDIAAGDLQSFWVRVRCPADQKPGLYRGTLAVAAAGVAPLEFAMTVKVRPFTLPACTPLPTAISFFEQKEQMGGEANWPTMKMAYADFLADYDIDYDSLYRQEAPDFEILQHLHAQGRLVAFNLGNVFNAGAPAAGFDKALADTVARLRPAYEKAKQLGLLDHAYIYGFDERADDQFGTLETCAQALRQAFPEVLLMTTSYDDTFGLDSVVKTIDAWCPLTPKFDVAKAAKARAAGKKVWWYICCGPHNPHANWFVEYAAIESRLLMGAMTAKYRPDGFLYYALTIWNRNRPIDKGPFTDWDPVSWTVYHGDGSLFHAGPGGKPVPSIRLENFRDGQEDYAYACLLEATIRRLEARGPDLSADQRRWLDEAKAALTVPDTLVKTMAEYSRRPADLYAWRERLADCLERSGVTDADPWGPNFGVRGFSATP